MRRSGAQCLVLLGADTSDDSFPGKDKGGRVCGEVDLPAQLKMPGGRRREATCPACHLRGFMVVVHSWSSRRAQVPVESAGDFVAIRRKPVKGAYVGNIW